MDRRGASAAPSGPSNYDSVTDTLAITFDKLMSRDAIYVVVESYEGVLELAANAIMNMIDDSDTVYTVANNEDNVQEPRPITKVDTNVESKTPGKHDISRGARNNVPTQNPTPSVSFADVSKAGAFKKVTNRPSERFHRRDDRMPDCWTDQMKKIMTLHNQGTRTLIIMRGAPGSGKSFLAKQIQEMTVGIVDNNETHIFSADDFFMVRGNYRYDPTKIPDAHASTQTRVYNAMASGVSPIIVDNTNITIWEMAPYVKGAVDHGYVIELLEPNTPWARNAGTLCKKNSHGVPLETIRRMIGNFEECGSSHNLLNYCKLSYHPSLKPPVLRNIPKFSYPNPNPNENESHRKDKLNKDKNRNNSKHLNESGSKLNTNKKHRSNRQSGKQNASKDQNISASKNQEEDKDFSKDKLQSNSDKELTIEESKFIEVKNEEGVQHEKNLEDVKSLIDTEDVKIEEGVPFQKNLEEARSVNNSVEPKSGKGANIEKFLQAIENVEKEWENGETWDNETNITKEDKSSKLDTNSEAKPPRSKKAEESRSEQPSPSPEPLPECNDWRGFMSQETDNTNLSPQPAKPVVETQSSETCMEIGDWINAKNEFKILFGSIEKPINATDVNSINTKIVKEKIPEKRMLDKSTSTSEPFTDAKGNHRCKNEEKHFIQFRNLFKNVSKAYLRDIFDKCCGDVNWATTLVLDGMAKNVLQTTDTDEVCDVDEEDHEPCDCTAHYDIMPQLTTEDVTPTTSTVTSTKSKSEPATPLRKQKKDLSVSDTSLAIKRQIEESIVISDDHYSQECLRVRKLRRGELGNEITNTVAAITNNISEIITGEASTSQTDSNNQNTAIENLEAVHNSIMPCTSKAEDDMYYDSDDSSDYSFGIDEVEKTVSVDIGFLLVNQLDNMFGRSDMVYPPNVEPRINIPTSLLNELNALWMESLMHQLETESKLQAEMIEQDEQFARELEMKEMEFLQAGKEPDVPDFKELMDMEFALSLYQKEIEEMTNKTPANLAAMLSQQKLFNLFPTIPKENLAIALMAFDNDFNKTVESVLVCSDRAHIATEKNGVNKFIISEELKRHQEFLEQQKRNLSQEQWPALPREQVDMATVAEYREVANKHLAKRNRHFQKAREYVTAGSTMAAYYYCDIAAYHRLMYEQANGLAAATLIQYHALRTDCYTIDLHYLRVPEAREALDLFLDARIQALRESRTGLRYRVLFIITGRGLHSPSGPKIKPAVMRRLLQRGLFFSERNAGLLATKVCPEHRMSYQLA